MALLSCEQDQGILTEYEGVNLIGNKGFDSPDWVPDQDTTYMIFEEATGFDPPPDAAGAAVYRLEITNLVADGEFETNTPGPGVLPAAAWSITGGATAEVASIPAFDGNCLSFNIADPNNDIVEFDLTTLLDGYPVLDYPSYILRFGLKVSTARIYEFYFPAAEDLHTADIGLGDVGDVNRFPEDFEITTSEFASSAGGDAFYITGTVQSGHIDNFRVVRTDIPLALRVTLPWADPDRPEGLPLVSGWYEFSVWVKGDPAAATTSNSFAGAGVTLGVENNITALPEIDSSVSFSDWIRVSTVFFVQIDAPLDPSTHVLELSIGSTDLKNSNSRDVGSLLIAAPFLELYSSDPSI